MALHGVATVADAKRGPSFFVFFAFVLSTLFLFVVVATVEPVPRRRRARQRYWGSWGRTSLGAGGAARSQLSLARYSQRDVRGWGCFLMTFRTALAVVPMIGPGRAQFCTGGRSLPWVPRPTHVMPWANDAFGTLGSFWAGGGARGRHAGVGPARLGVWASASAPRQAHRRHQHELPQRGRAARSEVCWPGRAGSELFSSASPQQFVLLEAMRIQLHTFRPIPGKSWATPTSDSRPVARSLVGSASSPRTMSSCAGARTEAWRHRQETLHEVRWRSSSKHDFSEALSCPSIRARMRMCGWRTAPWENFHEVGPQIGKDVWVR